MSATFQIHGVHRVDVSAVSVPLVDGGPGRVHWQRLELHGKDGGLLGEVVLFLDSPAAALPVGDRSELDRPKPVWDGVGDPF
jgi:hypothetical protein